MGQKLHIGTAEDFLRAFMQCWANTIIQTRIATPGEGEDTFDSVEMTSDDGGAIPIDLTRWEQFGDVVMAPSGTNCIVLRKSDGGVSMSLMQASTRPTNGKPGDRGLYCSTQGTTLFLRADDGRLELNQASGSSVVLKADGSIVLTDKDGKTATLDGDTLTVADVVKAKHFAGDGLPPSASAGAAVGTGTVGILTGTDTAFTLILSVVMGVPGTIATVSFQKPFDQSPRFVGITPMDDTLASPPVAGSFSFSSSTGSIDINTSASIPDGIYFLSVGVIQ